MSGGSWSSWLPSTGLVSSAIKLWAIFVAMCAIVDLVMGMDPQEKEEIRKKLGPYFDACMQIGKEFGFCFLSQRYASVGPLDGRGAKFDCNVNDLTRPTKFIERSALPQDLWSTCERAITPTGDSYTCRGTSCSRP